MKLLLAGGGTAGHVEPALAVARAWQMAHPADEIEFLGTSVGLENTLIPKAGFTLRHIPRVRISRSLSPSLALVPFQLVSAIFATRRALKDVGCAIGFGGYVSAPLYLAAKLARVPFVIHEQNAHPGWANRLGARLTKFTAISYPVSTGALARAELTGLPLRADVLNALSQAIGDSKGARRAAKAEVSSRYGLDASQPLVFIFGGSQGSQAINKVIDGARAELSDVSILHGVGRGNLGRNSDGQSNEDSHRSANYVEVGYIEDMAQCYLAADLLIARSGAVTCAEATALSRYSLFIPLPVGNGEQVENARSLVSAGRARVLPQSEFTPQWLVSHLSELLAESERQGSEVDGSSVNAVDKIVKLIERAAGVQ